MRKTNIFRVSCLVLLCVLFTSCKQYIKITPFQWASRDGFVYGGDSNKVFWKNDYYFIEYKNLSDKKLVDTIKSYFLQHYDRSISKYNQYDIFFCFRTTNFNEETIKKNPEVLHYQLDQLICQVTSHAGELIAISLYTDGKIFKHTNFYPPWLANK